MRAGYVSQPLIVSGTRQLTVCRWFWSRQLTVCRWFWSRQLAVCRQPFFKRGTQMVSMQSWPGDQWRGLWDVPVLLRAVVGLYSTVDLAGHVNVSL